MKSKYKQNLYKLQKLTTKHKDMRNDNHDLVELLNGVLLKRLIGNK